MAELPVDGVLRHHLHHGPDKVLEFFSVASVGHFQRRREAGMRLVDGLHQLGLLRLSLVTQEVNVAGKETLAHVLGVDSELLGEEGDVEDVVVVIVKVDVTQDDV